MSLKVKEVIELLQKENQEAEVFMFHQSNDGELTFRSDITYVGEGAVYNQYGQLLKGVLISKY